MSCQSSNLKWTIWVQDTFIYNPRHGSSFTYGYNQSDPLNQSQLQGKAKANQLRHVCVTANVDLVLSCIKSIELFSQWRATFSHLYPDTAFCLAPNLMPAYVFISKVIEVLISYVEAHLEVTALKPSASHQPFCSFHLRHVLFQFSVAIIMLSLIIWHRSSSSHEIKYWTQNDGVVFNIHEERK